MMALACLADQARSLLRAYSIVWYNSLGIFRVGLWRIQGLLLCMQECLGGS